MSPIKMLIDFVDVRLGVREIFRKELAGYLLPPSQRLEPIDCAASPS